MSDVSIGGWLITAGAFIFFLLGSLHARMTFSDLKNPRLFAPAKKELLAELQETPMAFRKGLKNFWTTSLGFHFSHSLGAAFYGLVAGYLALAHPALFDDVVVRVGIVAVGAIYVLLSRFFWFSIPLIGSALGVSLMVIGMVLLL